MCAATLRTLTRQATQQCTLMLLDASISAASSTCVVRKRKSAFKVEKGQTELANSRAVFTG